MKLIELTSENFKRLNVHVVMDGKSVTVEGRNGVGKSSFIDAVWIALTGKDIPEKPIQNGKDTAKINAKIKSDDGGEFIVERKFTQSGGTLSVKTSEGTKFSSPQKFLDEKIGKISFDPFEFINKPPREQKKFLMELLGIDLTDIEEKKKSLLAEKDVFAKQYQFLKKEVDSFPVFNEKLEEKNTNEVIEKFNAINAEREAIKEKENRYNSLEKEADAIIAQQLKLHQQIKEMKKEIDALTENLRPIHNEIMNILGIEIDPLGEINRNPDIDLSKVFELPETTNIEADLKTISEHNEKVKIQKAREAKLKELSEVEEKGKAKNNEIKELEETKIKILSTAQMPIEGLSFGEDGLLFEGLPLTEQQLSTAKLIEIGIRISMALNPSLRIMKVKDGSLLDSEMLSIIKNAAKEKDYQLFIERVSDNDEIGFVIEE